MTNVETKLRKGSVKQLILATEVGKSCLFPRNRYSTVRTTLSAVRIEYPEKEFTVEIVDNGIKVYCNK